MGVTSDCDKENKTSNSVQACSVLHVALVLVGVRRVTVVHIVHIVHIGYEDVLVVMYFCVAIFVRDLLYQEMFSLQRTYDGRDRMTPTTPWGSCVIVCCGGAVDPEVRG